MRTEFHGDLCVTRGTGEAFGLQGLLTPLLGSF